MSNDITQKPLATRDGYGQAMCELAQNNDQIIALCADLVGSLRLTDFAKRFPQQFVQMGVAEQNMMGVAAGLSLVGKIPFATSYAVFNPGRNWEQLRQSICYSSLNVKVVGGHAGLNTGVNGASHQCLEDIALTRVLPNMTVVVPCDYEEARKATKAIANIVGPAYLRLEREASVGITTEQTPFTLGKAEIFNPGHDVAVIACGRMVQESLSAAFSMEKIGISVRVINNHTIKPLDKATILQAASETGAIITVEEHQLMGGLGSAVSELLSTSASTLPRAIPHLMLGVNDVFGESGQPQELLQKYGLTSKNIIEAINTVLLQKRG